MLPGPTLIMKAPGCQKPVKFSTIASGNTFGATWWTDGKQEAPMLPDNPWLRKSPSEGVLFWSDACEQIGEIDPFRDDGEEPDPEWEDLEFAETPDEADYFKALLDGLGEPRRSSATCASASGGRAMTRSARTATGSCPGSIWKNWNCWSRCSPSGTRTSA
ncbi:MAG: hypothetical protein ACP5I4_16880 [Oceanipulchritudo sp.]